MEALARFPRQHASQSLRRTLHASAAQLKVQPQNLKGKSKASQDWLTRHLNDPYVKQSRYDNYRARSAYKLVEIDDKYHILKPGYNVVECGAAPGAWTQVIVERINANGTDLTSRGTVIGLDILPIDPIPGATFLPKADILKPETTAKLSILSFRVLRVGGSFLCKIWNGSEAVKLSDDIKKFFTFVSYVKPPASRKDSGEIYILGREFKGAEVKK
ncbi:hypothetical protein MTO96_021148 [Rhipicephalus appendiculatus]